MDAYLGSVYWFALIYLQGQVKMSNSRMQELLDQEATLSNNKQYEDRKSVLVMIKLLRGDTPMPCWGLDDCSTSALMTCPWRIDCGSPESVEYWSKSQGL